MKSVFRSVVFGFSVVSVLGASSAFAKSSIVKSSAIRLVGDTSIQDVVKTGVYVAAEVVSVPTAIASASALGVTAGTGTAISTLSGAAAVSATSAAIGASTATALTAATGVVFAPAVVGGVIIFGVASGVAYGFNELFFDED